MPRAEVRSIWHLVGNRVQAVGPAVFVTSAVTRFDPFVELARTWRLPATQTRPGLRGWTELLDKSTWRPLSREESSTTPFSGERDASSATMIRVYLLPQILTVFLTQILLPLRPQTASAIVLQNMSYPSRQAQSYRQPPTRRLIDLKFPSPHSQPTLRHPAGSYCRSDLHQALLG